MVVAQMARPAAVPSAVAWQDRLLVEHCVSLLIISVAAISAALQVMVVVSTAPVLELAAL